MSMHTFRGFVSEAKQKEIMVYCIADSAAVVPNPKAAFYGDVKTAERAMSAANLGSDKERKIAAGELKIRPVIMRFAS